jgi:hypothetical protein
MAVFPAGNHSFDCSGQNGALFKTFSARRAPGMTERQDDNKFFN